MTDGMKQALVLAGFAAAIGAVFLVNAPYMGHAYDHRIKEVNEELRFNDCEVCVIDEGHKYQGGKLFDDGINICCGRRAL